jgi:hypothetical protein
MKKLLLYALITGLTALLCGAQTPVACPPGVKGVPYCAKLTYVNGVFGCIPCPVAPANVKALLAKKGNHAKISHHCTCHVSCV